MDIQVRFGKRVRELRINKKWSQEKLASVANIDRTYVFSIEKGERNVSIKMIDKIASALEIEIIELLK